MSHRNGNAAPQGLQINFTPHQSGEAIVLTASFGGVGIQLAIPTGAIEQIAEAMKTARKNIPLVRVVGSTPIPNPESKS